MKQIAVDLLEFCRAHKKIYLYGTGTFAKDYYLLLRKNHIPIEGFVVTVKRDERLFDKTIYSYCELKEILADDAGIILAVREQLQAEILEEVQFECDLFFMSDVEMLNIEIALFDYAVQLIGAKNQINGEHAVEQLEKNKCQNILVIQLEVTYGDMVWSTAFLRELRNNFPEAHITYMINEKYMQLYEACPYIDEFILYNCSHLTDTFSEEMVSHTQRFVDEHLRMDYFDYVFLPRLLPLSLSDAWENVITASLCNAKCRVAHALYVAPEQKICCDSFEKIFHIIVKHSNVKHEVMNDLSMLKEIGGSIHDTNMELWMKKGEKEEAYQNFLKGKGYSYIVVGVVGSTANRSWDPDFYIQTIQKFCKKDSTWRFVLCGGNDSKEASEQIMRQTQGMCINLAGKTSLREVIAVIANVEFYIGSDTGLMHLAAALGKPVIEISASNKNSPQWWGGSATRTGPWNVPSIILQPEKGLDDCKYMCSKNYAHCINQVKPLDVYQALIDMRNRIEHARLK